MAKYLEKAKYAKQLIDKLETQHPGISENPIIYNLVHAACRAMPRVMQTVEENYVKEVVRLCGNKVKVVPSKEKNWKDEDYWTIKIEPKEQEEKQKEATVNSNPFSNFIKP